jgi:hypothetical protein
VICSVCKKGFAKPPETCDRCGGLACPVCMEKRRVTEGPNGSVVVWEITYPPKAQRSGTYLRDLCKNCRAEEALTES